MKYFILINQKALIDNNLLGKLDIIDLAIFDAIYDFFNCNSPKKITFTYEGTEYVEIKMQLIENQLPLINMSSKRTFINRINKLVDAGLLERYPKNQTEGRSGYKRGRNFGIFKFYDSSEQSLHTYENNFTGCENDFTGGVKINSHNNKDNIINKSIYKEKVKKENETFSMKADSTSLPEKEEKKSSAKRKEERDLNLPFSSERFIRTWTSLSQMPKWRRKTANALQMSLDKLSRYDEDFAIELMENAIAGDYQGLVFADTDRKYEMWKKDRERQSGSSIPPKGVRDCFFDQHKEWDESERQFQKLLEDGAYDIK